MGNFIKFMLLIKFGFEAQSQAFLFNGLLSDVNECSFPTLKQKLNTKRGKSITYDNYYNYYYKNSIY